MRRILTVVCLVVSYWALAGAAPAGQVLLVPNQYPTIQAAVDAAAPGDKIMVGPGDYAGAYITRPVELKGSGPTTRITSGSPGFPSAGFYVALDQQAFGDAGVAISKFRFESRPFRTARACSPASWPGRSTTHRAVDQANKAIELAMTS